MANRSELDVATEVYPNARSFDVRIDRFDNGRIEAALFVDFYRECRILGVPEVDFEDIIEKLKCELVAVKMI